AVAQMLMLRGDERAIQWAEDAIEQATAASDRQVLVQAKIEWASAKVRSDDRLTALQALREAAADARELGDGVQLSRALNNMIDMLPPLRDACRARRDE